MRVIYNGIDLFFIETSAFDVEPVYDESGVDYLYSRVTIIGRAVINGQASVVDGAAPNGPPISYDFLLNSLDTGELGTNFGDMDDFLDGLGINTGARASPTPVAPTDGTVPPATGMREPVPNDFVRVIRTPNAPMLTHRVIRHRLSSPRGKLFIFAGAGMETGTPVAGTSDPPVGTPGMPAQITIASPSGAAPCDCRNGPFPKVLGIYQALGDATTLMCDWACETYINESALNGVDPAGILLSNRFSQTHQVDGAGYTTITTEGKAEFRTDLLHLLPESPDLSRPILFMPIMNGFVRKIDYVTALEDVTGIKYGYTDTQVPVNFVAGPFAGVASISAVHRQAITSGADILNGALTTYERILGIQANQNFKNLHNDLATGRRERVTKEDFIKSARKALAEYKKPS